ncbi:hypothetical protein JKY72_05505 [Candidatus Gracilibacteria bacterium]|nr:hypothetical protein [Candidatus Gracilibacteria bacterium]
MGSGGRKRPMREIAGTKGAANDDAFEDIVDKIKAAGAEDIRDEVHPLYTDVGMDEFELGYERIVEFRLKKIDMMLIRKVEEYRLTGEGHQKSVEELETPRAKISLKRRIKPSDPWIIVDLDDMF